METNKTLVCPNCGANITNYRNCEYCGSLLVRFVDKGIDLQKTSYLDNTEVFDSLLNSLKLCLQMNEQSSEIIALDIYKSPARPIGSVQINAPCVFADGTPIPNSASNSLSIILEFDLQEKKYSKVKLGMFKKLDCSPLFVEKVSYISYLGFKRQIIEFYIDFGYDAEGAARLLSDIIKKVYWIKSESDFNCFVNVGSDNIKRSRRLNANKNGRIKSVAYFSCALLSLCLIVLGIIFDFVGLICFCPSTFFVFFYLWWSNTQSKKIGLHTRLK